MSNKTVLVTGGLGYIGTHTCVELFESGFKVIVVDNLSNSSIETGWEADKRTASNICVNLYVINESP